MNASPLVTILMATFNGEAYLKAQLDSLIGQTYKSWQLIVHDDGSTDHTLAILSEYQTLDSRIVVMADAVSGLGATGNFLHLINRAHGALYMFCDQDDIWLENKVAVMVEAIKDREGPMLVYANAYFYKDGSVVKQKATLIHPSTLRNFLFFNSGIQGCSIIMNAQLVDLLRPFPSVLAMHDHLFTLGAISLGKIFYVDEILMWYRQHKGNVSGHQQLGIYARIASFFKRGKPVMSQYHYKANRAFYERYFEKLEPRSRSIFRAYFQYGESNSRLKRAFIILKYGFSLGNKKGVLFLKTLIRKPMG